MVTSSLLSVVCVPASCSGRQPAGDDVVGEHGGQLRAVGQQGLQRVGGDGLERRVGRGEHGDVLLPVEAVAEVGGGDGLDQRGQRRVVARRGGHRVVGHPGEAALAVGGHGRAAGAERLVGHRRRARLLRRRRSCAWSSAALLSAGSSEPQALSDEGQGAGGAEECAAASGGWSRLVLLSVSAVAVDVAQRRVGWRAPAVGPERGWSAGDHPEGVPAAGAVRERVGTVVGLHLAVRGGGSDLDQVGSRVGSRTAAPTGARCRPRRRGRAGPRPSPPRRSAPRPVRCRGPAPRPRRRSRAGRRGSCAARPGCRSGRRS